MKIKTLKAVRNLLTPKSVTLPILENILIDSEYLRLTNLEISVKIKHLFPIQSVICVNSAQFIRRMEITHAPLSVFPDDTGHVHFKCPRTNIVMQNQSDKDFPAEVEMPEKKFLFTLSAYELQVMNIATMFVADDELRPVMHQVCISQDFIVSSDAHKLYYKKITPLSEIEVIFDPKLIKLMLLFNGMSFKISASKRNFIAEAEGVTIQWRCIDDNLYLFDDQSASKSKYPNWRSVIPKPEHKIILPVKETIAAIDSISEFANQVSGLVIFNIGKKKILASTKDIDFSMSATEEIDIVNEEGAEIEVGFKYSFLRQILIVLRNEGYLQLELGFTDPTKSVTFADQLLLMPMMIHD